jgi:endonuclease/exonuclease/phosphatase family metal-dependent hydrolase
VRLLHWNVHMWQDPGGKSNVQAVADLVEEVSPDVVSLVEVDEPWGRPNGLREVADQLGYCWVFVPAFEYRTEGGFGNALLSRRPLRAVQQWQLLSPRLYDGTEPSEVRAVILARVDIDGHATWVGSTHLPRGDLVMRAEASRRLRELLDQISEPWVLCGDFNQTPSDWLPTSATVAPSPVLATYPAEAPGEAIDYCVLGGITGEAHVLPSTASDHLPVVVVADVAVDAATSRREGVVE